MKTIDESIAYCGVDCGVCGDYTAGTCPGCRKSVWPAKDPCPPVGCCGRREISCCGECGDFPCEMMRGFYEESESHRAAGERMRQWHSAAGEAGSGNYGQIKPDRRKMQ